MYYVENILQQEMNNDEDLARKDKIRKMKRSKGVNDDHI